jgi:hypothetical protein
MRHADLGGTPSAFELLGQHRYVRAQAASNIWLGSIHLRCSRRSAFSSAADGVVGSVLALGRYPDCPRSQPPLPAEDNFNPECAEEGLAPAQPISECAGVLRPARPAPSGHSIAANIDRRLAAHLTTMPRPARSRFRRQGSKTARAPQLVRPAPETEAAACRRCDGT